MVTSLATETNNILRINNLLNKCTMYTTDKGDVIQTFRNDAIFKYILKDGVKDNRDIIQIYLNINNLHLKYSFKPEIFEDIPKDPFPTSRPTSVSGNRNPGTGTGTQPPAINIPKNVVTAIEDISKAIQKYTTKKPSTGSIGAATITSTLFNHIDFIQPRCIAQRCEE